MTTIIQLLYPIVTHLLALLFLTSALAKIIQRKSIEETSDKPLAKRISGSAWFPWLELVASSLLLVPLHIPIHALIATCLALVSIVGQALRLIHPLDECECFGSLTPSSTLALSLLCALISLCAGYIVVNAIVFPEMTPVFSPWLLAGTLIASFLIERKLRFDRLTGQGYAAKRLDLQKVKALPQSLVVGHKEGKQFTTKDFADLGKSTLIVSLSSHCGACRSALALLVKLSAKFSVHLTLAVITQNSDLYKDQPESPIHLLVDRDSHLGRFLGVRVRPFALYIGKNLELKTPPSLGNRGVQALFYVLSRAMSPEKTAHV